MSEITAYDKRTLNRRILRLAGPIILANLSVPMLSAVDTAVMGHLTDPKFLGAVAVGGAIIHFVFWGFGFLRMGTAGLNAQAFGAGDGAEVRAILARAGMLAVALGTTLVILQWPISRIGLALFDATPEVEGLAATYVAIRIWSAPAVLVNYAVMGWFVGLQNTRAVLIVQVFMNGLNIALDLFFVLGLGFDVAGVAFATLTAEVSALALGLLLVRREAGDLAGGWRGLDLWNADKVRRLFAINRDIFIRTLALMFAFAFFTARAAKLGDTLLAANAVLIQFQHFLSFGLDGFAHAAEALVGGALGARDRKTLRGAVTIASYWAGGIAVLYALVYGLGGTPLIALLTDIPDVRGTAARFLPWLIASPLVSVWSFMLDGVFIGATRTAEMRNAMILSLAAFVGAVLVLQPALGNHGLWLAFTLFMGARAVTLGAVYPRVERSLDPPAG